MTLLTAFQPHLTGLSWTLCGLMLSICMLYLRQHLSFLGVPPHTKYTPPCFKVPLRPGQEMTMLYHKPDDPIATLLFSHGHRSQMIDDQGFYHTLFDQGIAILAFDYPGYGHSDGIPSKHTAYQAIDRAYAWLTKHERIEPQNIFLYGHGLGCKPSIKLAQKHHDLAGLLLYMTDKDMTTPMIRRIHHLMLSMQYIFGKRRIHIPCMVLQGAQTSSKVRELRQSLWPHDDRGVTQAYPSWSGDHSEVVAQLIAFILDVHQPDTHPLYPLKNNLGPAPAMAYNIDNRTLLGSSRCWHCIADHQ